MEDSVYYTEVLMKLPGSEYLPTVLKVVNSLQASGLPVYVHRNELIQECLSQVPKILSRHTGRNGYPIDKFVYYCLKRKALSFIQKEKRRSLRTPTSISEMEVGPDSEERRSSDQYRQSYSRYVGTENCDMFRPSRSGIGYYGELPRLSDLYCDAFDQAAELLTQKQFVVTWCHFGLEMSFREIAEDFNITESAAKSFWRLALPKLRNGLKKTFQAGSIFPDSSADY